MFLSNDMLLNNILCIFILGCIGTFCLVQYNRTWMYAFCFSPILWTLQEYVIHRFLFHNGIPILNFVKFHLEHHKYPGLTHTILQPTVVVLSIGLSTFFFFHHAFGSDVAKCNYAANIWCLLLFELSHFLSHRKIPFDIFDLYSLFEGVRLAHKVHHFKIPSEVQQNTEIRRNTQHQKKDNRLSDENQTPQEENRLNEDDYELLNFHRSYSNYGFTSLTWDILFGSIHPDYVLKSTWWPILLIPIPIIPLIIYNYLEKTKTTKLSNGRSA